MVSQQTTNVRPLPGVTVTISAYNYAKFLPEAIHSVLQQDYPIFEVIVVDDGSTDNTAEVSQKFVHQYPDRVHYVHQKNAGLSAARNTGIKAARFDYVVFLDADDLFQPTMLRRGMEAFSRLSEDYAVVACRTSYMDIHGTDLKTKWLGDNEAEEITSRHLILKNRFSADAVIVKKSAFNICGYFDTTLRSSEDRDMWIRIGMKFKILLIPDYLLKVRRHSNSMSKHADRMKKNSATVIRKAYQEKVTSRSDWFFWLRVFSFFHFQTAWMYRDEGRHGRAMRDMTLSILLWPCFPNSRSLNEPSLFRLRSLVRFAREIVSKPAN